MKYISVSPVWFSVNLINIIVDSYNPLDSSAKNPTTKKITKMPI